MELGRAFVLDDYPLQELKEITIEPNENFQVPQE